MPYIIDARLDKGSPSLILIDVNTGEERLHWQANEIVPASRDLQQLFKKLMLLSCIEKLSLMQHAQPSVFGNECLSCSICDEKNNIVSLFPEKEDAK